ncbi:hypothetical protein ACFT25_16180 [Streptomyces hydrogenans]|uniref:hypothetical protein n=1 Tax=Streptomyces hydrogenans TaxID=1873719 RepID=UPI00363C3867
MSYGLAVWEGERPADDAAVTRRFRGLYDRFMETEEPAVSPSERIADFVAALLARWPDLAEDDGDTSPWSTAPLIGFDVTRA